METKEYQHWKLHTDENKILWLGIDRQDSSVNSLNQAVLQELDAILDTLATDQTVASVIFYSAKKTGFIAGADITQFTSLNNSDEAFNLIRLGQLVFNKIAALPQYTVAMVEGFCLGGGLELILSCKYRVAEEGHKTRMGAPEVLIGIHPGWLGTIRLPKLIGAKAAMKLILTGKAISAKEAAKLGLIDAAVPKRVLEKAAIYYATNHPTPHQPTLLQKLSNSALVRPILSKIFYDQLSKKIKPEYYPAPFAVIENWKKYGPDHPQAMLQEAKSISELMVHPTGRNLLRVFFLKEKLKGLAKGLKFEGHHVHVMGAGTMGSAIAAWCALSGYTVTLQDKSPELVAPGIKKAHNIIRNKLKSRSEVLLAMDRLSVDIKGLGIKKADVVIEAIIEKLEAKHELYREIEPLLKPEALLATNTSSLPLTELGQGLMVPNRLVGIHFFNPVEKMELVEVVSDDKTDQNMVNKAIAFVKKINRLPLPVLSSPGFLVNRILMPYLLESVTLLEEDIPAGTIDKAAKEFGMPMGPIELSDKVGLDVCLSVAEILTRELGGEVPERLHELVNQGKLGIKTEEGFYKYYKGKKVKTVKDTKQILPIPLEDLIDRLILRMVNESIAALREGIVTEADLVDAGMIFGTGFAPFRGGPLNYARARGVDKVISRLQELTRVYGPRFMPDLGWEMLKTGSTIEIPLYSKQTESYEETRVH